MNLPTLSHIVQRENWPAEGRHIMAHSDAESVVIYQAYQPAIGQFAVKHGRLNGPDFSLSRMSWIKPNFLWMMYRSGWGTKEGQEITLGLRLRRRFFDRIVAAAVPSSFDPGRYTTREEWQNAVESSEVRLQWDPDHSPSGTKLPRRAIQLGLRGGVLAAFAHDELLEVIDMTTFVELQRPHATDDSSELILPVETIYQPEHSSRP
jgi:Domain of unknown function (DUF4291)